MNYKVGTKTIAVSPGATIKEQLEFKNMTQKEFAIRMGYTEKHISQLLNGEVTLSENTAIKLEMVLNISKDFWLNLEKIYREDEERVKQELELQKEKVVYDKLPIQGMIKNKWLSKGKNLHENILNARKFFEVSSLELITNENLYQIACRRLSETEKTDFALLAISQKARLEARGMKLEKINYKKLNAIISELRNLTIYSINDAINLIQKKLASCGIAFIFLPNIGGSYLHGATFLDGDRVVLALTDRGKAIDKFWFSLFHELGHIVNEDIKKNLGTTKEDENNADLFAQETLIPKEKYDNFIRRRTFKKEDILQFADGINLNPYIVLGRLQKEEKVSYKYRYKF